MASNSRLILILLNDPTLGGTSRSAIMLGKSWALAGFTVAFYNYGGFHHSRWSDAAGVGQVVRATELARIAPTLIHLHHMMPSELEVRWVEEALSSNSNLRGVPVLTHNIFGRSISNRINHTGPWFEAAPAAWTRAQIITSNPQMLRKPKMRPAVVPNPQDIEYYHFPSCAEKAESRERLGFPEGKFVILRVGSPIDDKWHDSDYQALLECCTSRGALLVLVGAPQRLVEKLELLATRLNLLDGLRIVPRVESNELLRRYYWASDVFAASARRGETFGNVLLEALSSGLEVHYRKAMFRENAPLEFKSLPNFHYHVRRSTWVNSVVRGASSIRPLPLPDNRPISLKYSERAVAKDLAACFERTLHPEGMFTQSTIFRLSWWNWIEILVSYNPITNGIRHLRLRTRSGAHGIPVS